MLRIVKQAMLDARKAGATEEDVKKMMSALIEEYCAEIEDQEDRAWLIKALGEAIGAREKIPRRCIDPPLPHSLDS